MKKPSLFLAFTFIISTVVSQNLNYEWAINYGATGTDDESVNDIYVDQNAAVHSVGEFEGTVDFEPGAGSTSMTSAGLNDAYVLKLDSDGDLDWIKTLQSTNHVYAEGVYVDPSGNVFVCGGFKDTVDFDPGAGVHELTGGGIYLLKLDVNGDFEWVKHVSGNSFSYAWRIKAYQSHLILAGSFQGTMDFDPNAGTQMASSNGSNDVFVMSLDLNGNFEWMKQVGGSSQDVVEDMSVHSDGRIGITGWFRNTVDFDPGAGTSNLTAASSNKDDIFALSLNSNGDYEWAHAFGGVEYDNGRGIDFDSQGAMYVTGFFEGTGDFDPGAATHTLTGNGSWDVFVLKLDDTGAFEWAHSYGDTDNDLAYDLTIDNSDNVYLTGYYDGTVDWNSGAGTNDLTSSSKDLFLLKLDDQGNYGSSVGLKGSSTQYGNAIFADDYNGIWLGGIFRNSVDLEGDVTASSILSPDGTQDVCLIYLSQCDIDTSVSAAGFTLTANETEGSYQWYNCDTQTDILGETNASFTPSSNGNYAVIIDQVTCVDTSSCHSITGIGITENNLKKISIYPNPSHADIQFSLPNERITSISITDINGRVVKNIGHISKRGNLMQISISELESGVYHMMINGSDHTYRARFVKI